MAQFYAYEVMRTVENENDDEDSTKNLFDQLIVAWLSTVAVAFQRYSYFLEIRFAAFGNQKDSLRSFYCGKNWSESRGFLCREKLIEFLFCGALLSHV